MNAIDPVPRHPTQMPAPPSDRLVVRIGGPILAGAVSLAGACMAVGLGAVQPALAELRRGGLAGVLLASLLAVLAGFAGAWVMWRARLQAATPPAPGQSERGLPERGLPERRLPERGLSDRDLSRWGAWRRAVRIWPPRTVGDPALIGRAARWPQAVLVGGLGLAAMAACWWLAPVPMRAPVAPTIAFGLGGAAILLAFPLLLAERILAATPPVRLPEAAGLRALLLVPLLLWPAAGLVEIAGGLGARWLGRVDFALMALPALVAAELCLRAWGRCFLPPPLPEQARAACDSMLARLLAEQADGHGIAAPLRDGLGIDFARSWALAYLRAAAAPVALLLVLLAWGLTGVVLVGVDQRAVYERFGAPVAVLHPGLHAVLPWPLGQVRRLDYGRLHETALAGVDTGRPTAVVTAEAPPPPDVDRLWEQAHPSELTVLIASTGATRGANDGAAPQNFQIVSADFRLIYRIGMSDADALHAVYGTADPELLLRHEAGRVVAGFFASQTLDSVLGASREAMAARLRAAIQRDLVVMDSGIDLVAVAIEAVHPPAGAAEAYHNVQAAQIQAETSISAERGRAASTHAGALQYTSEAIAQARAAAAETVGAAQVGLTLFTADQLAAAAGGDSFLLERYFTGLVAALPKIPVTIIDNRIPAPDMPVLDLRPPGAASTPSVGQNQE